MGSDVDAWLTRTYERNPVRWMRFVLIVPVAILCLWSVPIGAVLAARYFGFSLDELWIVLAGAELVGAATAGAGVLLMRSDWAPLTAWTSASTDQPPPPGARAAALSLGRRLAIFLGSMGLIVGVPLVTTIILSQRSSFSWLELALVIASSTVITLYSASMGFFAWEVLLRPVRMALAQRGGGTGLDGTVSTRLAPKLVAGIFALTVTSGFLVGSVVAVPGSASEGAARAILVSMLITALLAASLGAFIALGVLAPVRDLIRGTRAVAGGDLETTVAVTTTDEVGDLAMAFNEMVADLKRRTDELRASQARLVASAADARRKVERDLHDGAQQSLVVMNLKLGMLMRGLDGQQATLAAELRADLERALAELRDLAHGIYPQVLTSDGLPGALAEAADQALIPVALSLNGAARRYPADLEAAIYFCCLEALQNAAKHGGEGAKATITLGETAGRLRFEVTDDGAGFDADRSGEATGLQNMADRIGALGGELRIESALGRGTRVVGAVPVDR